MSGRRGGNLRSGRRGRTNWYYLGHSFGGLARRQKRRATALSAPIPDARRSIGGRSPPEPAPGLPDRLPGQPSRPAGAAGQAAPFQARPGFPLRSLAQFSSRRPPSSTESAEKDAGLEPGETRNHELRPRKAPGFACPYRPHPGGYRRLDSGLRVLEDDSL